MRFFIRVVILFNIVQLSFEAGAQIKTYSAEESSAIHDSIRKSRWDIGGRLSQYSFRYMSEFFPVAVINKADKPYVFQSRLSKGVEDIKVSSDGKSLSLADYLGKLHIAEFIVIHKGSVVYEKYNTILPQDQHTLQSVTKVITSTLVTSLANEKKINLGDPVEKYLPELSQSDWKGITIRNILDMKSGMDIRSVDFSTGPFTNPRHKNYMLESALGILPKAANTPESVFKFMSGLKKDTAAGLYAAYSNLNTFILGWLCEKVTGKKYADLVSERIWQPMGASSPAYVCVSSNGVAWPHGGVSATLRDLARFGMLFTNSEITARKGSLISFEQLKEIFAAKPVFEQGPPFKWSLQWDFADSGVMMKSGFGGQALYIHPEKEIVIAYYNYVDSDWSIDNMISMACLNQIINAVSK